MKDEIATEEFVGLKPKMYSFLESNCNEYKKAKGVNKNVLSKILIDTDDKLPDDITLKNVVMLMTYVIKDDDKCYQQISSKEALLVA